MNVTTESESRGGTAPKRAPLVALLLRDFSGGGAERALINLANGLATRGHEVDLLVLRDEGPFRRYVGPHVRIVEIRSRHKGLLTSLGAAALVGYLRRRRPARLVSTLEAMTILAFFALAAVGRRRDLLVRVATTYDREPRPFLRRVLIRLVYRWHRGVFVTNSEASAANMDAHFALGPARLKVIYNAVDFDGIQALAMERPLPEAGLAPGEGFLLFAGRLTPAKRVDNLLRAYASLEPDAVPRLVILGDGPLRADLLAQVHAAGLADRVLMPGFTDNPYAWMSRATAFVLSSDYEGMPTVLIEALACGCPVVSTDCVSGPREVLGNSEWGELVPVGDIAELAAAMHRVVTNPPAPERLRQRARTFSIPAVAEAYAHLLFDGHGTFVADSSVGATR
jgi:glycosyltransferase involved in cell wall biosynthesis